MRLWGLLRDERRDAGISASFFAGLAVQQFLDLIVDPLLARTLNPQRNPMEQETKRIVYGLISVVLGAALAIAGLRVLQPLIQPHGTFQVPEFVDIIVTSLIISGGTQSFNSILKFLGAAKEGKKAEAQKKKQGNDI